MDHSRTSRGGKVAWFENPWKPSTLNTCGDGDGGVDGVVGDLVALVDGVVINRRLISFVYSGVSSWRSR